MKNQAQPDDEGSRLASRRQSATSTATRQPRKTAANETKAPRARRRAAKSTTARTGSLEWWRTLRKNLRLIWSDPESREYRELVEFLAELTAKIGAGKRQTPTLCDAPPAGGALKGGLMKPGAPNDGTFVSEAEARWEFLSIAARRGSRSICFRRSSRPNVTRRSWRRSLC
jgi:hypothetical protein